MNIVKIQDYSIDGDARVLAEREARCARIDALTVRRRQAISECRAETTPEAHRFEEWVASWRAVDETTRLEVLQAIMRLPAPIKGRP